MSQTTTGRPDSTSSGKTGLTRTLSNRVRRLEEQGRLPSPGAIFRALSLAVDEVLHDRSVLPPSKLERSGESGDTTVYTSSSTRENSTTDEAKKNYGGPDHRRILAAAARLGATKPGLGVWADGAEESFATDVPARDALRAAALLGLKANQKSVLVFTPGPGTSVRYRLKYKPASVDRVIGLFREHGVPFHTHFQTGGPVGTVDESHVVSGEDDGPKVAEVARKLQATLDMDRGSADFLGHESSREQARKHFRALLSVRPATVS